mgnify:CR=1 FL=1
MMSKDTLKVVVEWMAVIHGILALTALLIFGFAPSRSHENLTLILLLCATTLGAIQRHWDLLVETHHYDRSRYERMIALCLYSSLFFIWYRHELV